MSMVERLILGFAALLMIPTNIMAQSDNMLYQAGTLFTIGYPSVNETNVGNTNTSKDYVDFTLQTTHQQSLV
jgi:hypothetical protein